MAAFPLRPATALAPLGQLGVDWGVDATAGGDPTDDIRALLAKYEAEGIAAGSLGAVGYRVVPRRHRVPAAGGDHARGCGPGPRADGPRAAS